MHDAPTPRVFQHEGTRYAVRLEKVFLETLQTLAKQRGVRTGALIAGLAHGYTGKNLSSYLRAFCLTELRRMLLRVSPEMLDLDLLLKTSPAAGLLLSETQTVIEANAAFTAWCDKPLASIRGAALDDLITPRVTRPLHETLQMMAGGKLKSSQFLITCGEKTAKATLVMADRMNKVWLLWLGS